MEATALHAFLSCCPLSGCKGQRLFQCAIAACQAKRQENFEYFYRGHERMPPSTNDDRLSPCIAAAICEAWIRAVLVAGSGCAGLRRNSGMDDGDTSTVNEEKQRCSLP